MAMTGTFRNCCRQRPRHRQLRNAISHLSVWNFLVIILYPRGAQVFTSEIRLGGLGSSLVTVRASLRSEQSPVLSTLHSHTESKFSNPGSLQSIRTRTFLLRTILHIRNCLIICPSSARIWQLSSNSPMPRRSRERRGRMPGRTAGNAGDKVTN